MRRYILGLIAWAAAWLIVMSIGYMLGVNPSLAEVVVVIVALGAARAAEMTVKAFLP